MKLSPNKQKMFNITNLIRSILIMILSLYIGTEVHSRIVYKIWCVFCQVQRREIKIESHHTIKHPLIIKSCQLIKKRKRNTWMSTQTSLPLPERQYYNTTNGEKKETNGSTSFFGSWGELEGRSTTTRRRMRSIRG